MKTTRSILVLSAFAVAGLAFLDHGALAASSISYNVPVTGTFYMETFFQLPGISWTFSTDGLSPGSDTVIHVQDSSDPQGGFIAGNDDNGVGFSSQVTVTASPTARTLHVIVRSYSDTTQGTCMFHAVSSDGQVSSNTSIAFGGSRIPTDVHPAGTHVTTVELQGDSADTVLLVTSDIAAHAIAYDDDDGVGHMSWVHLPEQCTSCQFIVARYYGTGTINVNLIADEDVDSSDPDGDGVGSGLEAILTTSRSMNDSDGDGILDGQELFGVDTSPILKLPAWGADPTKPDLFVEADWNAPGAEVTSDLIPHIKADFLPIRVHFDIGVQNTDPATWTDWGDWGGASYQPTATGCEFASPERIGFFHFLINTPDESGQSAFGSCTRSYHSAHNIAHELGHSLGLSHAGLSESLAFNFKANYVSRMSYGFQYSAPTFSHGLLRMLNPTHLDETAGVGSTDPTILSLLAANGYKTDPSGKIDWDRDGNFAPSGTTVRGNALMNDFSYYKGTEYPSSSLTDPARSLNDPTMTWVSVGGTVGDQFWIFGRGGHNQLQYVRQSAAVLNNGCGAVVAVVEKEKSNCAGLGLPTDFPGDRIVTFAPGAAEVSGKILVVSQPASGPLVSSVITTNSTTGALAFGANVNLPGNLTASSDVTVLATATGTAKAWAISGGRLKEWTYSGSAWTGPVDQKWADGTFISPLFGIGATMGFQDGSSTSRIYAAIPTAPNGVVEFSRKESNGQWTKLSTWNQATGTQPAIGSQPAVQGRPGLAYQRQGSQPTSPGRFYMALNQGVCSGAFAVGGCIVRLIMTEGNLEVTGPSVTTRRLVWIGPAYIFAASYPGAGVALMNDLTRDTNLRGAATYGAGNLLFMPLADGIVNGDIYDIDDYQLMSANLSAALGHVNRLQRNDYDGDRKTDLVVFRPSAGTWFVRPSAGGPDIVTPFGTSADVPVPGDYDGDRRTDAAFFRPSDGTWHVRPSSGQADIVMNWGVSSDVPVPGDYDGDSRTDFAVYRPSSGMWLIRTRAAGNDISMHFGLSTDVPVPGDYNGDRMTDYAIFRPSNGGWFIRPRGGSSDGTSDIVMPWGTSGDRPVAGDYDGDGMTDFAVYRPGDGTWYVRPRSGAADITMYWGISSDVVVPGDYDGDGQTDFAIYRPANGNWYVRPRGGGSDVITNFGLSTDIPPFAR